MRQALGVTLVAALLLAYGLTAAASAKPGGYSALCVVGKDENLYVREWVDYHKCLGE